MLNTQKPRQQPEQPEGQCVRSVKGEGKLELQGLVTEALPKALFRVVCEGGTREVLAMVSGSMRHFALKILPGDRVTVTVSPYDPNRGRITGRHK